MKRKFLIWMFLPMIFMSIFTFTSCKNNSEDDEAVIIIIDDEDDEPDMASSTNSSLFINESQGTIKWYNFRVISIRLNNVEVLKSNEPHGKYIVTKKGKVTIDGVEKTGQKVSHSFVFDYIEPYDTPSLEFDNENDKANVVSDLNNVSFRYTINGEEIVTRDRSISVKEGDVITVQIIATTPDRKSSEIYGPVTYTKE